MRSSLTGSSRFRLIDLGSRRHDVDTMRAPRVRGSALSSRRVAGGGPSGPGGTPGSPPRVGSAGAGSRRVSPALAEAEDRARDHEALDLARALVDLRHLRVAVVAFDRELRREAVAAEDLERLSRLAARDPRREELGFRARLRVRLPPVAQPPGP